MSVMSPGCALSAARSAVEQSAGIYEHGQSCRRLEWVWWAGKCAQWAASSVSWSRSAWVRWVGPVIGGQGICNRSLYARNSLVVSVFMRCDTNGDTIQAARWLVLRGGEGVGARAGSRWGECILAPKIILHW